MLIESGKLDDLLLSTFHLCFRASEQHTVEINVLPPAHFQIESGTDFNQRCYSPAHADAASQCRVNAHNHLQQCGLAGAIQTNYSDSFATTYGERKILQRVKLQHVVRSSTLCQGVDNQLFERRRRIP